MAVLVIIVVAGAVSCRPGAPIREAVRPTSPYEQYAASVRQAGLAETAVGREWFAAGERALREPVVVALPFREAGYLSPHEPAAVAYRVELRRGQRLIVEVTLQSGDPARLFIDAFELPPDGAPERIAYAEASATTLTIEPLRDGAYLVRVQPELLRGGRYEIVQRVTASLRFPLDGFDTAAVRSIFGDPRDAGSRDHHGIDIFAPRGTAVVSASGGWVTRVRTTPRGGRVVWVWDPSGRRSIYYAHLDEQLVTSGQRVSAGDVLGRVGTSGNARTTPPHLHFGIYVRGEGPVDPLPFVDEPRTAAPPVNADLDPLGRWMRTARPRFRLRAGSSTLSPILTELPRHTVVRVEAATADWYRVALPDGTHGYLIARAAEALDSPIRRHQPEAPTFVRRRPGASAAPIADIEPGARLPVLGEYREHLLVRLADGRVGWI